MSSQSKVVITKVELIDGEEMQGLIKKVIDAIARGKGKTKKSLQLTGIFKDHIITRDFETGRFFKMRLERDGETVKLSDEVEVKQVFVPVAKTEKAESVSEVLLAIDEGETTTVRTVKASSEDISAILDSIEAEAEYVEVKETSLWEGVL